MKAMIFAAGLGSRLKPHTNRIPKALVEVSGKPLLLLAIEYLKKHGVTEAIINIHHFGEQIIEYCSKNNFGIDIYFSDERNQLLDTGGGLKKASEWLSGSEPFIVVNADIITNVNIQDMFKHHKQNGNVVTLAVRDRDSSRKLMFNDGNELCAWKNTITNEVIKVNNTFQNTFEYAFSGLHVISPSILIDFPSQETFSIIKFYLGAAKKYKIGGYVHNDGYWFDVGTPDKLFAAEQYLQNVI